MFRNSVYKSIAKKKKKMLFFSRELSKIDK